LREFRKKCIFEKLIFSELKIAVQFSQTNQKSTTLKKLILGTGAKISFLLIFEEKNQNECNFEVFRSKYFQKYKKKFNGPKQQ
jgi:hypothetical protein